MVLFFNVINNKISYARLLKNINLILTKYLDLFVCLNIQIHRNQSKVESGFI